MPDDPHRDDLAAAQARIEALERDNEDLRARLEQPPAPQPVPPAAAPPVPPPAPAAAVRPPGVVAASPDRGRTLLLVVRVVPLVVIFAGLVAAILLLRATSARVDGTVTASGPRLGSWTMPVHACRSGQTKGFFGVDLWESQDDPRDVRLIRDPVAGTVVNVNEPAPSTKAVQFREGSCKVLDAVVEQRNSSVNDVVNVRGHLVMDCTEGGDHVEGRATFENCH